MRDKSTIIGGGVLFLAAALIAMSFFQTYYIGSSGDGDLLWNANEVYLLVHGERRGYRMSGLGYAAATLKGLFGVIDSPDDRRLFTEVIQITPSAIRGDEVVGTFAFYTPRNQNIYALHGQGMLSKWVGTHFEQASPEEQQKVEIATSVPMRDFTDVNGWSARYSVTTKINDEYKIQVSGGPLTLVVKTLNLTDGEVSLDLVRPGRSPETVYQRIGRPRRVSRTEYDKSFEKPD
jgi:hypothetical protein